MKTFTLEITKFKKWIISEINILEKNIESDSDIIKKGGANIENIRKACERLSDNTEFLNFFKQTLEYYNTAEEHNDYGYFSATMQEYLHRGLQAGVLGFVDIEREFAQKISKKWISVVASAFNQ